jgi:hypothetical protein
VCDGRPVDKGLVIGSDGAKGVFQRLCGSLASRDQGQTLRVPQYGQLVRLCLPLALRFQVDWAAHDA